MKTKLYITFFIVAVFAIFLLFPKPQTLYSGKYYAGNTNKELVLKPDNSFAYHISGNRTGITISGKYQISNNHIELLANDKKDNFFIDHISSGDVAGAGITFKHPNNGSLIIFTKSQ